MAPKPQNAGRKPVLSSDTVRRLDLEVDKQPEVTLAELRERCELSVSVVTVHNALKKLGFKRKKTLCAAEQQRAEILTRRHAWLETLAKTEPTRLVFLEKTGAKMTMTRTHTRVRNG